jgi:hypothetical protein
MTEHQYCYKKVKSFQQVDKNQAEISALCRQMQLLPHTIRQSPAPAGTAGRAGEVSKRFRLPGRTFPALCGSDLRPVVADFPSALPPGEHIVQPPSRLSLHA